MEKRKARIKRNRNCEQRPKLHLVTDNS
jgi:hypothetical protein